MTVDWVVFDLGGVVLAPTEALPTLAATLGVPPTGFERFAAAYAAPRLDYDRTSDAVGYWSAVAQGCGVPPPDPGTVDRLVEIDNDGWSLTDPATVRLIEDLHGAGVPLAILSNMPSAMGELVRSQPWAAPFRHFVISGDLKVVKPDPRIYAALTATLDAPAERIVFTDDLQRNISAAATFGLRTVLFDGAEALRESLRAFGLDV